MKNKKIHCTQVITEKLINDLLFRRFMVATEAVGRNADGTLTWQEVRRLDSDLARAMYRRGIGKGHIDNRLLELAAGRAEEVLMEAPHRAVDPLGVDTVRALHQIIEHHRAQEGYQAVRDAMSEENYREAARLARPLLNSNGYLLGPQKTYITHVVAEHAPSLPKIVKTTVREAAQRVKSNTLLEHLTATGLSVVYGIRQLAEGEATLTDLAKDARQWIAETFVQPGQNLLRSMYTPQNTELWQRIAQEQEAHPWPKQYEGVAAPAVHGLLGICSPQHLRT